VEISGASPDNREIRQMLPHIYFQGDVFND